MKALVTGADGFIGSHLTEMLLKNGWQVRALAMYNSHNYWGWLEEVPRNSNLEIVTGDIRDVHVCNSITHGIDVVFHLAALIAIPWSYTSPDSYVDTNVKGTLNMCQASRLNGVRHFIHTSTSEVYGTALYIPIDEKHPRQPQSPYSASKIGADAIAFSFFSSFDLPVTIARPFNTYGPRQSARAIIPSIITQIISGEKSLKAGNVRPTRDMNFVYDTCKGLMLLAGNTNSVGLEINISSGTEISIADLIDEIKKILGSDIKIDTDPERLRPEKSEVYRLCGDNSRIRDLAGYKPDYSLDEGLRLTCNWFLDPANRAKYKAGIYNV